MDSVKELLSDLSYEVIIYNPACEHCASLIETLKKMTWECEKLQEKVLEGVEYVS